MKREADLPIHSFLPATCPTYPILPHPTKPSPTEKQKPKTKNQKRKRATANYPKSFLTFLYSSSPPPFSHDLQISLVDRHRHPHRHWKFEFHFSLRACMHTYLHVPSHLTSCVPYTFHVLTHTVGIRYLMYLLLPTKYSFRRRHCQHTTHIQHTG